MSSRSYGVAFTNSGVNRKVVQAVQTRAARRVSERRRKILSRLEWRPICDNEFSVPEELLEVEVPDEWTAEGNVRREKMVVSASGDGLTVILSDNNLPEKTCEKVVRLFVQELHMRVTGKHLSDDEIEVSPLAMLMHRVCEFCSERIIGPSYSCPVCRRCFCYEHRRPETHGCSRNKKNRGRVLQTNPSARVSSSRCGRRPVVVINKVPCG